MEDESPGDSPASENEDLMQLVKLIDLFERPPTGLAEAWTNTAHEAEGSSTARIFLDKGGYIGWVTYFVAKKATEGSAHFAGKARCRTLIAGLKNKSDTYQEWLAKSVTPAIEPGQRLKIDGWYEDVIRPVQNDNTLQNRNKRQRTTRGSLPPSSPDLLDVAATPSGITTNISVNRSAPVERAPIYPSVNSIDFRRSEPNEFAGSEINDFAPLGPNNHVLINANLPAAMRFYPQDLSSSIRRLPHPRDKGTLLAGIWMTFSNDPEKLECHMSIHIKAEKIPHLAWKLFGVHLEIKDGLRYIYLPGGSKILPNPKFTLQGCPQDLIASVFGLDLAKAIETSPKYIKEVEQCVDRTDCVAMVISHLADEGATFLLSLGLWEGARIRKILFP